MTLARRLRTLLPLLVTVGCSEAAPDPEPPLEPVQSEILGGTTTSARPEVVLLGGLVNGGNCTGTLIAPREFMTAAHCIGFRTWQWRGGWARVISPTMACVSGQCPNPLICDPGGTNRCADQMFIDRIIPQGAASGANDLAVGRLQRMPSVSNTWAQISTTQPSNTNLTVMGFGCTVRATQIGTGTKRYKTYFYQGQNSFNYCEGDSGGPTFLGNLLDGGAIVRLGSAYDGGNGVDIGADAVSFRPQLLALSSALETPGISYRSHVQEYGFMSAVSNGTVSGTTGQSLRLEALQVWSATPGLIPCYRAHVQDVGWQAEKCDGMLVGTVGEFRRMEAFQIRLSSKGPYARVQYRAYLEGIGWQAWINDIQTCSSNAECSTNLCSNGKCAAGTTGQSRRLEAVQILVL